MQHNGMSYTDLLKGRHSQTSGEYHIRTGTHCPVSRFTDPHLANTVARTLHQQTTQGLIQPLCWVLMPDHLHLHLLLRLDHRQSLAETIKRFKALSARAVNRSDNTTGPVWQSGYFDRALRNEDNRLILSRYIVANPLRADLARRVGDYPWWDSIWL